jgi:chromate transporter
MIYWSIFLAFFIPGIVGYGGGPASIPLVENEVVDRYEWMTVEEFGEVLAIGNALPGPIATKMAGYIGYAVAPSLLLMIFLLGLLTKFKDSPKVKSMTNLIRPAITILLGVMTYQFFASSYYSNGILQTLFLIAISLLLLEKLKVHPAFVIFGALGYGAFFL